MSIDPDNDPNEAYEMAPATWRDGWWTVTCNGIPVQHFSPSAKEKGERYCRDPACRLSLVTKFFHDKQ